jgi:hypothetical protein
MPAPFLLVASLVAFSDERITAPSAAALHEHCVEVRQFRGGDRGGCRVAIDRAVAWLCMDEVSPKGTYGVRFKAADGKVVRELSYEKRQSESWGGHVEIFYTSADKKKNPDLKIGLAGEKDGTVVIAKTRHCIPAESAKTIPR